MACCPANLLSRPCVTRFPERTHSHLLNFISRVVSVCLTRFPLLVVCVVCGVAVVDRRQDAVRGGAARGGGEPRQRRGRHRHDGGSVRLLCSIFIDKRVRQEPMSRSQYGRSGAHRGAWERICLWRQGHVDADLSVWMCLWAVPEGDKSPLTAFDLYSAGAFLPYPKGPAPSTGRGATPQRLSSMTRLGHKRPIRRQVFLNELQK